MQLAVYHCSKVDRNSRSNMGCWMLRQAGTYLRKNIKKGTHKQGGYVHRLDSDSLVVFFIFWMQCNWPVLSVILYASGQRTEVTSVRTLGTARHVSKTHKLVYFHLHRESIFYVATTTIFPLFVFRFHCHLEGRDAPLLQLSKPKFHVYHSQH